MALKYTPGVTGTITAAAAMDRHVFIKATGTVCGAGEKATGITMAEVDAAGKPIGVMVSGIGLVMAGAAISQGDQLESDANGHAIPKTTGEKNGIAWSDAAQGELVQCVPTP